MLTCLRKFKTLNRSEELPPQNGQLKLCLKWKSLSFGNDNTMEEENVKYEGFFESSTELGEWEN